jgi:hypothetical protein
VRTPAGASRKSNRHDSEFSRLDRRDWFDGSLTFLADEITVSAPDDRVDLEALKRPRLGGKESTRLSHQP